MMELDWQSVGTAVSALAAMGAGVWAGVLKFKKTVAEARADVATSKSEQVVADAQGTVYRLMEQRLIALEGKVAQLEKGVQARDDTIRQLHQHISRLEQLMREKGIEPPTLVIATIQSTAV